MYEVVLDIDIDEYFESNGLEGVTNETQRGTTIVTPPSFETVSS